MRLLAVCFVALVALALAAEEAPAQKKQKLDQQKETEKAGPFGVSKKDAVALLTNVKTALTKVDLPDAYKKSVNPTLVPVGKDLFAVSVEFPTDKFALPADKNAKEDPSKTPVDPKLDLTVKGKTEKSKPLPSQADIAKNTAAFETLNKALAAVNGPVVFVALGPVRDRASRSRFLSKERMEKRLGAYGFARAKPIGGGVCTDTGGTIGTILCDTQTNWPYALTNQHVWTTVDTNVAQVHAGGKIGKTVVVHNAQGFDFSIAKMLPKIWARSAVVNGGGGYNAITGVHAAGQGRPKAGANVNLAVTKAGHRTHYTTGYIYKAGADANAEDNSHPDYIVRGNGMPDFADDAARVDHNIADGDNSWVQARWRPGNEADFWTRLVRQEFLNEFQRIGFSAHRSAVIFKHLYVNNHVTVFSHRGDSGSLIAAGTDAVCLLYAGRFAIYWTRAVNPVNGAAIAAPVANSYRYGDYWVYGAHDHTFCYAIQPELDEANNRLRTRQQNAPTEELMQVEICTHEFPLAIHYDATTLGTGKKFKGYIKAHGGRDVNWLKAQIAAAIGVQPGTYKLKHWVGDVKTELTVGGAALSTIFLDPPHFVLFTQ